MCGILGGTDPAWNYRGGITSLKHRGPDDLRVVPFADVTLAFCRLAIIDLSPDAGQPMSVLDGKVWIVFNGEIYDYRSLRAYLLSKGHRFKTNSDTEVLLNAYLEWGDDFVNHVDGMFAVAIYDTRSRKLKLFRDRVGIKPLYYLFDGKNFAFASELKAILALCEKTTFEIDRTSVYDYLTYMYVPEPKSVYKNIFKLCPAHELIFDLAESRIQDIRPYWELTVNPQPEPIDITAATARLKELIRKSVSEQMIADVPLGFFLSGGMDSSTIVAEASTLHAHVETFSIGFDEERHSETLHAQKVAARFKTTHHERILSRQETVQSLEHLKKWYDEPFADTSAFPTYLVSKVARENVTVALTGDGGDEVLGGYRWYSIARIIEKCPYIKNKGLDYLLFRFKSLLPRNFFLFKIIDQLELWTCRDLEYHVKTLGGMLEREKKAYARLWDIPKDYDPYWYFRKYYREGLPLLTRLQYLDFHTYLPSDVLTKIDRTSMAVSLEARVPLLSKEIIEFSFSLPESVRYYKGQLKGLLKETYKDVLPPEILTRPKKGFSIPKYYLRKDNGFKQEQILKEVFHLA